MGGASPTFDFLALMAKQRLYPLNDRILNASCKNITIGPLRGSNSGPLAIRQQPKARIVPLDQVAPASFCQQGSGGGICLFGAAGRRGGGALPCLYAGGGRRCLTSGLAGMSKGVCCLRGRPWKILSRALTLKFVGHSRSRSAMMERRCRTTVYLDQGRK